MRTLWQDLRYGSRMLMKSPGVTVVAVIAIALGISANTTIFSTVHALILQPFSFANQERLIVVWEQNWAVGNIRGAVAPGNFMEWRERNQTCERLVAIEQKSFDLTGGEHPERVPGYRVTQGFFEALGAKAAFGRTFLPEESETGRDAVVVLKYSLWQQRFGGDAEVVGKTLTLDGRSFTIVGVMPADFNYPYRGGDLWTPFVFDQNQRLNRSNHSLNVIGLLKPDVTIAQAQADLGAIAKQAQQQFPETNSGRDAYVVSLNDDAVRGAWVGLRIAVGAVGFVLLIACANVANLLLARAAGRQKEMAVRLTLGASRWRLARQVLTESMLLACMGGALGLLISVWAIEALPHGIPEGFAQFIPGWNHFGINRAVLVFTLVVSVATGIIFGLAPALQATRTNLNEALKEGGKGQSGTGSRNRLRSVLVVSEVALSLMLLIGAGLMVRSFVAVMRADLGIRSENVLVMEVALPRDKYQEKNQSIDFYEQLLLRVEALPGVRQVGAINMVPLSGWGNNSLSFQIVGRPPFAKGKEPFAGHRVATPGYFEAIGTSLRKGRLFTAQDDLKAKRVVLINDTFAKSFFDQEPIGQQLKLDDGGNEALEIIGVVADVKNDDLDEQADPAIYVPYAQNPRLTMNLILYTDQDPAQLTSGVRDEVQALDRNLPVYNIKTMQQMINERISPKRLLTYMMGAFALMALVLAAVGIYAMMSYAVTQRTHEIGIRLALGAQVRDILRLMIGQGLMLTLIGVVMGLAGGFAVTRTMSGILYHIKPSDPLTFVGISLLLAGVSLLACYLPARRATKVDPMIALRYE